MGICLFPYSTCSFEDIVSDSHNGLLTTDKFPEYACGMCEHVAVERNMHRSEEDTRYPPSLSNVLP